MALAMPKLDGVEHRYAQVNGVRLHYAEAGEGETVVLQHGWPQHWWAWRDQIGPLAERFRVICPDLRGFGWSEAPRTGYEKDQLARDLVGLLDELGVERARLVGHDWGAFAGYLACFDRPDRFERFVAVSVGPPWRDEAPSAKTALRAWYQVLVGSPVLGQLAVGRLGFAQRILQAARKAGSWTEEELRVYGDAIEQPGSVQASVQLYRTFVLRELPSLARGRFNDSRLTVPTLLLMGASDPLRSLMNDLYRERADDMTVEIVDGASHFLPEEKPDLVRDRLLEFLS